MLNKLNQRRGGFTLVEIMIVVAIIALLAAIAVPGFLRARKRAQATKVLNELRIIDSALDQFAIENNLTTGAAVNIADLKGFFKVGTPLYETQTSSLDNIAHEANLVVDTLPAVPAAVDAALNDVLGADFWEPYIVAP